MINRLQEYLTRFILIHLEHKKKSSPCYSIIFISFYLTSSNDYQAGVTSCSFYHLQLTHKYKGPKFANQNALVVYSAYQSDCLKCGKKATWYS